MEIKCELRSLELSYLPKREYEYGGFVPTDKIATLALSGDIGNFECEIKMHVTDELLALLMDGSGAIIQEPIKLSIKIDKNG